MVAVVGILVGAAIVALGALHVKYAYAITRFEERLDAIGSKRDIGTVEPADWKVALTKVIGATVAGAGVVVVVLALLD
jgi:hypothetical protein